MILIDKLNHIFIFKSVLLPENWEPAISNHKHIICNIFTLSLLGITRTNSARQIIPGHVLNSK